MLGQPEGWPPNVLIHFLYLFLETKLNLLMVDANKALLERCKNKTKLSTLAQRKLLSVSPSNRRRPPSSPHAVLLNGSVLFRVLPKGKPPAQSGILLVRFPCQTPARR